MVLPDLFLDHDRPNGQYETAGLNARHIVATALAALGAARSANSGTRLTKSPSPAPREREGPIAERWEGEDFHT
jgi:hypothetical protein